MSVISFKSRYHYWKLVPVKNGLYLIYHRHNLQEEYHLHNRYPTTRLNAIMTIQSHDYYVATHSRR